MFYHVPKSFRLKGQGAYYWLGYCTVLHSGRLWFFIKIIGSHEKTFRGITDEEKPDVNVTTPIFIAQAYISLTFSGEASTLPSGYCKVLHYGML